jgi:hypothetical protein
LILQPKQVCILLILACKHVCKIVPIEVKAGSLGKMKSLHLFLREKQASFGVRCSLENFDRYEKIKTLPLYAIGHLFKSIKH